jgi:hypothetical protein
LTEHPEVNRIRCVTPMEVLPVHATLVLVACRLKGDVLVHLLLIDVVASLTHPNFETFFVLSDLGKEPRPMPIVKQLGLHETLWLSVKLHHRQELSVDVV